MKSTTKSNRKVTIPRVRSSGPYSATLLDSGSVEQKNKQINSALSSSPLTNFDKNDFGNTRISKTLPRMTYNRHNSENYIYDNNYNNFDNYQSNKVYSTLNNNFESNYYSSSYNQSSITPSNSMSTLKSSSRSTVKYSGSYNSNYNLRSSTYNSGKTIQYSDQSQDDDLSSPIISGTRTLSRNVVTTSHPLPPSNYNNTKVLNTQPSYQRTVNSGNYRTQKLSNRTSKSSLEMSPSNEDLSPSLSETKSNASSNYPSRPDDSVMSLNTLELYELYSSAAAYVKSTSSPILNSPKFMENFRSLSRNFKMKEFSSNSNTSPSSKPPQPSQPPQLPQPSQPSQSLQPPQPMEPIQPPQSSQPSEPPQTMEPIQPPQLSLILPSTKINTITDIDSFSTPSLSSYSISSFNASANSQNSNTLNRNDNYSSKNTVPVPPKRTINPTIISNVNSKCRVSRSQPDLALPDTSNASKAYASLLRDYKYSGNSSNTSNFTNVQELQPVSGDTKATVLPKKDIISNVQRSQVSAVNSSPRFTPPLSYSQINSQPLNENPLSVPVPRSSQVPTPNIGKRKQSIGFSPLYKDKNASLPAIPSSGSINRHDNSNLNENKFDKGESSSSLEYKNHNLKNEYFISSNDANSNSCSNENTTSSVSEPKQPFQLQTRSVSPQLKLIRHSSNSPVLKHQVHNISPQLAASLEKPLPPSPLLTSKKSQKRSSAISLSSLNNQKPLPSPVLTHKHQSLSSPQLSSQSPLQSYVTLEHSSSSESSLKYPYPVSNITSSSSTKNNLKINTSRSTSKTDPSSPTFANAAILGDKIVSPHSASSSDNNLSNNFFSYMHSQSKDSPPVINHKTSLSNKNPLHNSNGRINYSPKLLNNPFIKKDQELQQQQQQQDILTHLEHTSTTISNINTPTMLTTSTKISSSPKITSQKITSPVSPSRVNSPKIPYSNIPMNTFNYKSLGRTSSITNATTITDSPSLSVQSTPKATFSTTVIDTNELNSQSNNFSNYDCLINKRISSFNIEHQFQEQLQEQIHNGNSSIKSNKYDDYYTLPSTSASASSVNTITNTSSTNTNEFYKHFNNSEGSLNMTTNNKRVSPKLQQTVPSVSSMTPFTSVSSTSESIQTKYGSLDRSKRIHHHKRNISLNDEKYIKINESKDSPDINSSISQSNISNISTGTENNANISGGINTENKEVINSFSSLPENMANMAQRISNDHNNYISQAKSVHAVSYAKRPLSLINEKIQKQNNTKNEYKYLIDDNIENINLYDHNNEKVAYKQLKQSYPESSGFIKKDILKALQQKAKNRGSSSSKWWSYWKKESKNTSSGSVFKTALNTSIIYASVSLDSVDEENPRRIPIIIYKCVQYLKKYGLKKEGIFRVNGSERRIQATVKMFDESPYLGPDSFENLNVYDVASLIKLYIRQLPDALFPNEIYLPLLRYYDRYTSEKDRIKILQLFMMMFPRNYLVLLEYLLDLFRLVTRYSEYNQMNSSNLARVFAPNLLKPIPPAESSLKDYGITSSIIEFMIEHDLDFHISRSENMLLKILQRVPDFNSNKSHKAKKPNLRIPFMAINNIFSDNEETDDDRGSRYKLPLTPPQSPSTPTQSTSVFSNIKSQLNALKYPSSEPKIIDSNLNIGNTEEIESFNNLTLKRDTTSFSVIRPNPSPSSISDSNTPVINSVTIVNAYDLNPISNTNKPKVTIINASDLIVSSPSLSPSLTPSIIPESFNINSITPLNKNNNNNNININTNPIVNSGILRSNSVGSIHSIQHSNSKTIIRKNTIEENDNSSRSPSNDMSIERNNSNYSLNKYRQTASEI
ncbi:hypothetical protein U3516DRAFT_628863 [Neocallimastix sp. 'constans']